MKRHRPAAGQYTLEEQDRQCLYAGGGLTWVLKRCADCKTIMTITMYRPRLGIGKNWPQKCDPDFGMHPVLEAEH